MFLRRNMAGFPGAWGYRSLGDWDRPTGSLRTMSSAELKALNTPEAQRELDYRMANREFRAQQAKERPELAAERRRAGHEGPSGGPAECAPGFSVEEVRTGEMTKRAPIKEVVQFHLLKDGQRTGRFYLSHGAAVAASHKPWAGKPPKTPMTGAHIQILIVDGELRFVARQDRTIFGVFNSVAEADAALAARGLARTIKSNPYFDNSIHSALVQSDRDYTDPTIVYSVFSDEE